VTTPAEIHAREKLTRLWSESEPAVHAFLAASIRNFQDAEDVAQQTALTIARRFDEYDPARPFLPWALWIAKSRLYDYYRKKGRERLIFDDSILEHLANALTQQHVERSARHYALQNCLEKLPEKSQRIIQLRYHEEMPLNDLAQQIQSTPGSLRVMLTRIRDVLGECIQRQLHPETEEALP
jgi:RNA polymerase sigma-70 factor, ECF subfamily